MGQGYKPEKMCDINSFNYRYTVLVMSGRRGAWGVGNAKKIKDAMVAQGFAKPEDFTKESEK